MNEYDLDQKPDFDRTELPNFHEVFNASPMYRNRELLEFVFRLLIHGTPGHIVAEMMSSLYWSLDNTSGVVSGTFRSKSYHEYTNTEGKE